MVCTLVSCACTALLSPPPLAKPHVTTVPSCLRAAKAPAKAPAGEKMVCTLVSCACTELLSPPRAGWPQVTTLPWFVTVKLPVALMPSRRAVNVVLPAVMPVATPAALTVEIVGALLLQATRPVTSNVEPSL